MDIIGMTFDELLAGYRQPMVEENSSHDGNRIVSVMETKCICPTCESGDSCLLGFTSTTMTVNPEGIIIDVAEEE